MIPKVIHYCWFGQNPLPKLAINCIKSWKRYFPDYEIIEWNEDNFNINVVPYVKEAYDEKKYAFVSDYARFWILYHYGGLYFDTDVEVIHPMDDIIRNGAFMGCEEDEVSSHEEIVGKEIQVAPGLGLGSEPNNIIYKTILDKYSMRHFKNPDGSLDLTTVVKFTTDILKEFGLKNAGTIQKCGNITIYPQEYFCPLSWRTGLLQITDKTVSIHHYSGSWLPKVVKQQICENRLRNKHRYLYKFYYHLYLKPKIVLKKIFHI